MGIAAIRATFWISLRQRARAPSRFIWAAPPVSARPIACSKRRISSVLKGTTSCSASSKPTAGPKRRHGSAISRWFPLRKIPYRGVTLQEMDLDAILARKPEFAIVDELAHTNASGSRHNKRYQDVEELVDERDQCNHRFQHPASGKPQPDGASAMTGVEVRRRFPILFSRVPTKSSRSISRSRNCASVCARAKSIRPIGSSRRSGISSSRATWRHCASWRCARSRAIRAASAKSSKHSSARADAGPR